MPRSVVLLFPFQNLQPNQRNCCSARGFICQTLSSSSVLFASPPQREFFYSFFRLPLLLYSNPSIQTNPSCRHWPTVFAFFQGWKRIRLCMGIRGDADVWRKNHVVLLSILVIRQRRLLHSTFYDILYIRRGLIFRGEVDHNNFHLTQRQRFSPPRGSNNHLM